MSTRRIEKRSISNTTLPMAFFQTRIGNDSDLIHFFKSSGPELEEALLACLKGADVPMKIEVLKAGSTLSAAGDARFTLAALDLSEDSNAEVRQTVRYVYEDGQRGVLNLDTPAAPDPRLVSKVVSILDHGNPDSQAVVLPLLAALPEKFCLGTAGKRGECTCAPCFRKQPQPKNYAQVLDAASSFKSLMRDPDLQKQVLAGLRSFDPERAAGCIAGMLRALPERSSIGACGEDGVRRSEHLRAEGSHGRGWESAISEEAPGRCRGRGIAGPGLPRSTCGRFEAQRATRISNRGRHGACEPAQCRRERKCRRARHAAQGQGR